MENIFVYKVFLVTLLLANFFPLPNTCLAGPLEELQTIKKNSEQLDEFKKLSHLCRKQLDAGNFKDAERLTLKLKWMAEKTLAGDQLARVMAYSNLASLYQDQGRYTDAELLYKRSLEISEKFIESDHPAIALSLDNLGELYQNQGRYDDAEPLHKRALKIREKALGSDHRAVAESLNNLAVLYQNQGRYADAEPLYGRALKILKKALGSDHPDVAASLDNLATLYNYQGRYADAEPFNKRALKIREKALGNDHPAVAANLNNLALLYQDQGRYADAESLYKRALKILEKALGSDHPDVATSFDNLALLYQDQGRYADAESLHKRALKIREKALESDHPAITTSLNNLALLYQNQGRYADAEPLHKRALKIREKTLESDHPDIATSLYNLALLHDDQGHYADAKLFYKRALKISEEVGGAANSRLFCYWHLALLAWKQGEQGSAVKHMEKAMLMAEQIRKQASGADYQRAATFAMYVNAFNTMVEWQTELGHADRVLDAMERSRARTLLDQMELGNANLLTDLPQDEANQLRDQENAAKQTLATIEKKLINLQNRNELSNEQQMQEYAKLFVKKLQAQKERVEADAAIRNASPAYRLAMGKNRKPVSLARLSIFVESQKGVLLEYLIGNKNGFLLALNSTGKSRMQKLSLTEEQAKVLGVKPGPLNASKLQTALRNENETGVLQLLAEANNAKTTQKVTPGLATLWEVLVPEAERKAITDGACEQIFVLPDANLAQLPFETLVVEQGEDPKYLLDVGPAVIYAPSATILMNLVEREIKQSKPDAEVVTIGNPTYPGNPVQPPENMLAMLSTRSRFGAAGGHLSALPHTKTETRWVKEVYAEKDASVVRLDADDATEANVRRKIPGRRVVHLACHGLVDQKYGNLFGALALTPGEDSENMEDDGFLTLSEVYGLDLKSCELAILSACNTNFGPQQRGEGTWAISRGFLVAGAKRVVASNWLVDDEAAASLVSYFCGGVAEGGDVDHAKSLQAAKRWIKDNPDHPNWKHPYYWAPFILVGPR